MKILQDTHNQYDDDDDDNDNNNINNFINNISINNYDTNTTIKIDNSIFNNFSVDY